MNANIQQISELEKVLSVKNATNKSILSLFGQFALGRVLSKHSLDKKRGVDMVQLILSLMFFRINQATIGSMYDARFYDLLETGKNCYYRFMNRPEMNWRVLLLSMACRFCAIVRKYNAEESPESQCYIVDDTTEEKTGFHLEGLSRVLIMSSTLVCQVSSFLCLPYLMDAALMPAICLCTGKRGLKGSTVSAARSVNFSSRRSAVRTILTMGVSKNLTPGRMTPLLK